MEHQKSGGPAARSTNPILTFVSVIYLIYGGLSAGVALFSVYALIQQGAGFMLEAALLLAAMLTGGARSLATPVAGEPASTPRTSAPWGLPRPMDSATSLETGSICTPMRPRLTRPLVRSCSLTRMASSIGMANEMPMKPPERL